MCCVGNVTKNDDNLIMIFFSKTIVCFLASKLSFCNFPFLYILLVEVFFLKFDKKNQSKYFCTNTFERNDEDCK